MPDLLLGPDQKLRCAWCGTDPLYMHYHDTVWGVPEYDSEQLFAKLMLDGQQAGLSWITILRKESAYRELFKDFDPAIVADFPDEYLEELLQNPAIIRNRLKVYGIRKNAQAYLRISERQSFADFLWQFAPNERQPLADTAAFRTTSPESDAMSKALKKEGMTFVGSTICYAFMQAVGMINDHLVGCFRAEEVAS
jgi:DNA-3-methyladenine glycosylase I